MPGACCPTPVTRIIKVADFEAGLVGLDQALQNVFIAGVKGDEEIKGELLRWVRDFGNYVSGSREEDYKQALLREYKSYVVHVDREIRKENERPQKR
jgi:hypothetical protein